MRNAIFAMLVCAFSSIATAQVTVVRAGRLVEPDSGTVLTDQVILVDGGKIQAVGKGLAVPAGAKVIDLSDKTVLPGFIDCHTLLADGNVILNGDTFDAIKKTASQIVLESVPNAQKTLLSGFTTVEMWVLTARSTTLPFATQSRVETLLDLACMWLGRTSRSQVVLGR